MGLFFLPKVRLFSQSCDLHSSSPMQDYSLASGNDADILSNKHCGGGEVMQETALLNQVINVPMARLCSVSHRCIVCDHTCALRVVILVPYICILGFVLQCCTVIMLYHFPFWPTCLDSLIKNAASSSG